MSSRSRHESSKVYIHSKAAWQGQKHEIKHKKRKYIVSTFLKYLFQKVPASEKRVLCHNILNVSLNEILLRNKIKFCPES